VVPSSRSRKQTKAAEKKSVSASGHAPVATAKPPASAAAPTPAPARRPGRAAAPPKSASALNSASGNAAAATTPKKLKVALIGFGTVGRSVVKLLCQDADGPLLLTQICNRNVEKKKVDWVPASVRWTESVDEVLSSDADVVVELVGGIEPAGDWIRRALSSGKSVVTANKL
jgi:hypothetical protein